MSEPIEDPDITLVSVVAGPSIATPGPITVDVTVHANHNAFEDESAYRLYVFLCCCHGSHESSSPVFVHGHLGDGSWPTEDFTFHFTFTVTDLCPDLCTAKVALLEGGLRDTDSIPAFAESNPVLVVCPVIS